MSGKIFSATDGKYRFHNCVEYELQSVLESSIFGWSCVFGLSSPSHVEGLPFPCHNIPEYIPSIARSCKTTEMSELKSNKAAVLLQQVFGFAIKLFYKDKILPPCSMFGIPVSTSAAISGYRLSVERITRLRRDWKFLSVFSFLPTSSHLKGLRTTWTASQIFQNKTRTLCSR